MATVVLAEGSCLLVLGVYGKEANEPSSFLNSQPHSWEGSIGIPGTDQSNTCLQLLITWRACWGT